MDAPIRMKHNAREVVAKVYMEVNGMKAEDTYKPEGLSISKAKYPAKGLKASAKAIWEAWKSAGIIQGRSSKKRKAAGEGAGAEEDNDDDIENDDLDAAQGGCTCILPVKDTLYP